MADRRGQVVTFYSYKGGTGRTFALADVAVVLAQRGQRVLAMDWDLEAPGLFHYLRLPPPERGVLDWIESSVPWQSLRVSTSRADVNGRLVLIGAGSGSQDYKRRVQDLDWNRLYEGGFGNRLEEARAEWTREFDFVLIDSRTGISDIGGVCTIQLPSTLVVFVTPNNQSLEGAIGAARVAQREQARMPITRFGLRVVPVPARLDPGEQSLYKEWMDKIVDHGKELVRWMEADGPPARAAVESLMYRLAIPQKAYWAYGEGLSIDVESQSDPKGVRSAHEALAQLLLDDLDVRQTLAPAPLPTATVTDAASELDVYLSIAGESPETVEPLVQFLRREGFTVWSRLDLEIGDNAYAGAISALKRCRAVLVVPTAEPTRDEVEEVDRIVGRLKGDPKFKAAVLLYDETDVSAVYRAAWLDRLDLSEVFTGTFLARLRSMVAG